jgi:hypothetical protein
MHPCHLKGEIDDRLHAVLRAAGYIIRWLLRAIASKGLMRAFFRLLPVPAVAAVVGLVRRPLGCDEVYAAFKSDCGCLKLNSSETINSLNTMYPN